MQVVFCLFKFFHTFIVPYDHNQIHMYVYSTQNRLTQVVITATTKLLVAYNKKDLSLISTQFGRKTGQVLAVTSEGRELHLTHASPVTCVGKENTVNHTLAPMYLLCEYISLTSCSLTKCQGDREVQSYHVVESREQTEILCQQHSWMLKIRNCRSILLKFVFHSSL